MNSIRTLLRTPYNKAIRDRLPRKIGVYNGVAVRYPRFLDFDDHTPDWKEGTVGSVKRAVREGDTVVEIGTGFGVCAVWAARNAGEDGQVRTYEASADRVEIATETSKLNGVSDRIDVTHALIGEDIDIFGSLNGATQIAPMDLPDHDILVADCEGAERDIVAEIGAFNPRTAVIETHGFAGSPTEEITDLLRAEGYTITNICPASPRADPEQDNKTVVGHRE